MKYGVVFPQTEFGNDPVAIREYAQALEEMGLDYVLAYDHVLGANPDRPGGWSGPYTHRDPFHEPFVLFAFMAAATRRLEFATGIIILPQRPAALVAKQAASLDVLSGGRLRLGVAVGWNQVEMEGLGYGFANRARRMEEQIEVMRQLWAKPLVSFNGRHHRIDDAGINPLPVQQPFPLWLGGGSKDGVVRRIARLADGWMMNARSLEEGRVGVEKLRGYLKEFGRDPAEFGLDVRLGAKLVPESEWDGFVGEWERWGATHLSFNTMGLGFSSPEAHLEIIRRFVGHFGR